MPISASFSIESAGARVAAAASAAVAMGLLAWFRPDALLCDIRLPDEDGYALIKRVRLLGSHEGGNTPAVALTAYVHRMDETAALSAGYHRHVRKPVDVSELITAVAELAANTPTTAD